VIAYIYAGIVALAFVGAGVAWFVLNNRRKS
jgi:hypothetical protein